MDSKSRFNPNRMNVPGFYAMVIGPSEVQFGLLFIQVITKSDNHAAAVRFVYHKYSYRQLDDTKSDD